MLTNRTITRFAVLGLLLPLALILLRQSDRWIANDTMDCSAVTTQLEALDNIARLPTRPTLVLGGHMAQQWPEHISELGNAPVLVRATRGLSTEVIGNCFNRVIGHYRPSQVVVMLGDIELNKLETQLAEELRALSAGINNLNANITLVVTGLLRTPARDNDRVDRLNRAVASEADGSPRVSFLDPNPALTGDTGQIDPRRFWPDGDTLDVASYDDLARIIDAKLKAQTAGADGV